MHASPTVMFTLLAGALCAAACSSGGGAPRTAPDSDPVADLVPPHELVAAVQAPPAAPAPTRFAEPREGRLFEGAPPVIAHPIGLGTECSECHLDGSEGFDDPDIPPPTPHPELTPCRMCHVFANTSSTFRENDFQPAPLPLGMQQHDLAPPLIPHPLTMRERCVVCHNHGEASTARWRQDLEPRHSEGWNCRMCHAPRSIDSPGPRPGATPFPLGED